MASASTWWRLTTGFSALVVTLGCEDDPGFLCNAIAPAVEDPPSLSCAEPDPPGLDYLVGGPVIEALLWGRYSQVELRREASRLDLIWIGERTGGELDSDLDRLELHGGPCNSDCNATIESHQIAVPRKPVVFGGRQIREFGFYLTTPRLCVPPDGRLELPPGRLRGIVTMWSDDGETAQAPRVANIGNATVHLDFTSRELGLQGTFCSWDPPNWGAVVDLRATIVKVPPVAVAGPPQNVECATASGTEILLDGSASWDADGEGLNYQWWRGEAETGEALSAFSTDPTLTTVVPPGTQSFTLVVYPGWNLFSRSRDRTTVTVSGSCP